MSVELDTGTSNQAKQIDFQSIAKNLGMDVEDMQTMMKEIAPILSAQLNLTITRVDGSLTVQKNAPIAVDAPELDNAQSIALTIDLEALIAYLQIENDEEQLEVSKTRIEALKGGIEADHLSSLQTIEKSIDEAREAEEAAQRQKRLGIIGAIISVVATVVIGVLTGGVAVAAISLAVMGVMKVLDKTGATAAMAEGLSEALQKAGVDKDVADKIGKLVVGVAELVAAIAIMVASPTMVKGIKNKIAKRVARKTTAQAVGKTTVLGAAAKEGVKTAAKTTGKEAGAGVGKGAGKGSSVAKEGDVAVGEKPPVKEGEANIGKKDATKKEESTEMDELDADGKKVEKSEPEKVEGEKSEVEKSEGEKVEVEKSEVEKSDLDRQLEKIDQQAKTQRTGQVVNAAVMGGASVVNTGAAVYTAAQMEDASEAEAAVKEAQAYLKEFQTRLEEEEDTLMAILQMMNDNMAALADILESQSEANAEITSHIGG